ncbi:MAG TPA: deoxyribonuclease IV [Candidatus Limnocylindrales bacterium]|nr:deoxyribonuclease IV [Candidatus Limnocylindrales bacterium]
MLPDGRRLGAHLALGEGMVKAAERAVEIGLGALQVFSDNPTAWRRRAGPSPEIPAFRSRLVEGGIAPLTIHASYLVNLAGSDPTYHERSVTLLAAELRSARRFGATLVNVHIGSHGGAGIEAGIERLVSAVRRALDAENEPGSSGLPGSDEDEPDSDPPAVESGASTTPATIVLENSAGGGFGLGVDLDELTAIADALDAAGVPRERIGFCLDTAHAWGAGHDLSDPAVIDAFVDDLDRRIGLDRLPLVHLNDSRAELGSRLDRHEHIGAGKIGETGMAHLLRHPRLAHATYILETPGMDEGYDAINVARAVALARGEPLAALPPEAFTLRSSRARAATPIDPSPVERSFDADPAHPSDRADRTEPSDSADPSGSVRPPGLAAS